MEEGEDGIVWCVGGEVLEVNVGKLGCGNGTNGLMGSWTLEEDGEGGEEGGGVVESVYLVGWGHGRLLDKREREERKWGVGSSC